VETCRRANSSFDDMALTDGIAHMNNAALIQQVLDQALGTRDFSPLAARLADDVVFEVTPPEGVSPTAEGRGKQAVLDYFTSLGDIVTFWRVRCFGDGERVVVVGAESFTIPRYGITLGGEFALLLTVCNGLITRFLIIEELSESPALEVPVLENA
jgi:ketosteroid isomerase-like protein